MYIPVIGVMGFILYLAGNTVWGMLVADIVLKPRLADTDTIIHRPKRSRFFYET